jgi:hypothetical protein
MATTSTTYMRRVARMLGDDPLAVLVSNALIADTTDNLLTLGTGEGQKVGVGTILFSDDYGVSNSYVEPVQVISKSGDAVTVRRAYRDSTALAAHDANTYWKIAPRFDDNRISDAIQEIADSELYPWVWNPGETTTLPSAAATGSLENFALPVSNVEDVNYAYQIVGGRKYPLHTEWVSKQQADNTVFPNGMLIIRRVEDGSTIYVSYKSMPAASGAGNTAQIDRLMVLGAAALLQRAEEMRHVAPARSAIQQRIGDGAQMRAGQDLWIQFLDRRDSERVRLLSQLQPWTNFVGTH